MGLQFTLNEYTTHIRMSGRKHLLVEGKGDKYLFKLLLNSFRYDRNAIDIDTAEELIGFECKLGNRERVETVCLAVQKHPRYEHLVGFVDREFRGFTLDDELIDNLPRHKILGRLVWSRGHSIENYYFDFNMLNNPLKIFSATEYFDVALDLFQRNLESVIRYACAASLAGRDTATLKVIRASSRWEMFKFEQTTLNFNRAHWEKTLINSLHLKKVQVNEIVSRFNYWYEKVQRADLEVARWLCHGHIGLSFIWAAYGACIFEVCRQSKCDNPAKHVQRILKSEESVRFNACAANWVEKAIGDQSLYPVEVLELLNITPVKI